MSSIADLPTESVQIEIVAGPSKFDLMNSLFVWKPNHLTVDFMDPVGTHYEVMITAVEAEDGSGEKWLFKGREIVGNKVSPKPLRGFIDTHTRMGHLVIEATVIG